MMWKGDIAMTMQPAHNAEMVYNLDDPRLLAALETNTSAAYADFARSRSGEVEITPTMTRYISGVPVPIFNGIGQARLAPDDPDAQIEAALKPFAERGLPMWWWVGPSSRPTDLGARLEAHGLAYDGDTPGMALDLRAVDQAPAAPVSLTISAATNRDALEEWSHVTGRGFGIPDDLHATLLEMGVHQCLRPDPEWVYFVGRLNGRPVATSALFMSAGVAGIYCIATLPDARRQGIGAELTRAALLHAREQGYAVGILQSSQMGFHVYQELGFRTVLEFGLYEWPG